MSKKRLKSCSIKLDEAIKGKENTFLQPLDKRIKRQVFIPRKPLFEKK